MARPIVEDDVMNAPPRTPHTHAVLWAVVLVVASASAVVVGVTERAMACSCSYPTDTEAFEQSDAVFVGTLVEVQTPPGDVIDSSDLERFIFDVDAVYKGAVTSQQAVATAREGASCGLEIAGPGPFLVFAGAGASSITPELDEDELQSNLCSGTRPSTEASVPAAFGQPAPRSMTRTIPHPRLPVTARQKAKPHRTVPPRRLERTRLTTLERRWSPSLRRSSPHWSVSEPASCARSVIERALGWPIAVDQLARRGMPRRILAGVAR